MRRMLVLAIAGLLTVGSIAVAGPAGASENPNPCPYGPDSPPLGTVYFDDQGKLHINPGAAGSDVDNQAAWAVAYTLYWASCLADRLPTDGAFCLANLALEAVGSMDPTSFYFRYVYESAGEWIVDFPTLFGDTRRAIDCTGISVN